MFISRLSPILTFCLLVLFVMPVYAQDDATLPADRTVITPENIAQLQPLGRYGTGELSDAFAWSPDESTLAIGGATGIWLYASDALTTPFDFIPTERYVDRVAFSPDGRYLAYRTRGYRVHLLDYATRTEPQTFANAQAFTFHPERSLFVVGTFGYSFSEALAMDVPFSAVTLWDVETHQRLKTFEIGGSDWGGGFVNFDFSADGTLFAAAWRSGEYSTCGDSSSFVKWWRFDDILNHTQEELSYDYDNLIGTSLDNLYDVKFHSTQNVFVSVQKFQNVFPPSGILMLHDPLKNESTPYDLGKVITEYEETSATSYYETIEGFDFNGGQYADSVDVLMDSSGAYEDTVHTIRLSDGTLLQKLTFGGSISAYAAMPHMTVAMDGRYRVADGTGRLVNIGASEVWPPNAINDDGSAFLTRDIDGAWRLWTMGDDVEEIALPSAFQDWMPSFIPGGQIIKFDAAGDERRFALWDFNAGTSFEFDAATVREDRRIVDFSANGERMAVQHTDGQIEVYDTSSGNLLSTLDFEFDNRVTVAFRPDGTHLTTAHFVDTGDVNTSTLEVHEWTSQTGALHRDYGSFQNSSLFGETSMGVFEVRYSTDGEYLGVQSFYNTLDEQSRNHLSFLTASVFDVAKGEAIFTHLEEDAGFKSGLFSDDLRRYALDIGTWSEATTELYDVERNALIVGEGSYPYIHESFYAGGAAMFSPDNKHLMMSVGSYTNCGGDFRALYLHDTDTLAEVAEIRLSSAFMGFGGEHRTFTADSRMLMIADGSGTGFYDAQTGELITEIADLDSSRLHFSADNTLLIAARDDGTVTLWGIPADSE